MDDESYWDSLLELEDEIRRENGDIIPVSCGQPSPKLPNNPYSKTIFTDCSEFMPISANNPGMIGQQFYVRIRPKTATTFNPSELMKNFEWKDYDRPFNSLITTQKMPSYSSVFNGNESDVTPRFYELLSDPRINRELLGWIKEWDGFVFKRESKPMAIGG